MKSNLNGGSCGIFCEAENISRQAFATQMPRDQRSAAAGKLREPGCNRRETGGPSSRANCESRAARPIDCLPDTYSTILRSGGPFLRPGPGDPGSTSGLENHMPSLFSFATIPSTAVIGAYISWGIPAKRPLN